jgi:hypothetical protein
MWQTFGTHGTHVDTFGTPLKQMEHTWNGSGTHLEDIWNMNGIYLEHIWNAWITFGTRETHVEDIWNTEMEHIWNILGHTCGTHVEDI